MDTVKDGKQNGFHFTSLRVEGKQKGCGLCHYADCLLRGERPPSSFVEELDGSVELKSDLRSLRSLTCLHVFVRVWSALALGFCLRDVSSSRAASCCM